MTDGPLTGNLVAKCGFGLDWIVFIVHLVLFKEFHLDFFSPLPAPQHTLFAGPWGVALETWIYRKKAQYGEAQKGEEIRR